MRILCVPSAVGFSHVSRLLLVAARLTGRGHEVTFGYGGEHGDEIAAAGHAVVPVHDVRVADPQANVYLAWTDADVERALASVREAIEAVRAQVVVADFHPAATGAARQAGVPAVGIVPFELAPGFDPAALQFGGGRPHRLASRAVRALVRARSGSLAGPFARGLGLPRRGTLADVYRGDLTLVAELESFAPTLTPVPGQRITGPLVWEETAGDPLGPPPPGVARVYATIGNTGRRELLELAARALGGEPSVQLVMTSGRYADPPPGGAPNVRSYALLPGGHVVRDSRLAIHCGGRGTLYQALAAGIPSIVVPFVAGQQGTARLVTRHGVGVGFEPRKLDSQRLRLAVRALLLDDGSREHARRFAALLADTDGAGAAADAVESLA